MITTQKRTIWDALLFEPLDLAVSQPHQILLSTGSIALMGSFASSSNIVHPLAGYLIAIGVEWAYLRGLASDSRAQTAWGGILNWSAFAIVVLWGVLWCAQQFKVFDEASGGWALAAAHVVPVAWLSLCSAQCHRAAIGEEKKHAGRLQSERENMALDFERKQQELALWEQAQEAKARLKMQAHQASNKRASHTFPESINADDQTCPKCSTRLDRARWMAAKRWGYCAACKNNAS